MFSDLASCCSRRFQCISILWRTCLLYGSIVAFDYDYAFYVVTKPLCLVFSCSRVVVQLSLVLDTVSFQLRTCGLYRLGHPKPNHYTVYTRRNDFDLFLLNCWVANTCYTQTYRAISKQNPYLISLTYKLLTTRPDHTHVAHDIISDHILSSTIPYYTTELPYRVQIILYNESQLIELVLHNVYMADCSWPSCVYCVVYRYFVGRYSLFVLNMQIYRPFNEVNAVLIDCQI